MKSKNTMRGARLEPDSRYVQYLDACVAFLSRANHVLEETTAFDELEELARHDSAGDRAAIEAWARTPPPALDSTRPEEALVDLDDPKQGALGFAGQPHAFPHAPVEPVHGVAVQPTQRRCLQSRQIGGDVAHDLTDLGLRNP